MSSMFDDLWLAASPAIDATFGDRFVFIPMRVSGNRPAPDVARAEVELTAALVEQPKEMDLEGKRIAANTASPIMSAVTVIDFATDALPYPAKQGDRLMRLGSGALYEISGVKLDGIARTTCAVFQKGTTL